jgi:phage shock protein C
MAETRLTRDLDEAMLGGVLAGLAARYGWDVTPVRIVVVLLTLISVGIPGVVIYLAAWVIVPAGSEIGGSAASGADGASDAMPATGPEAVVDEVTAAVQEAAERLGEAGQIAAEAVRQAAEEIGEVVRRPREDGSGPDEGASGSSDDRDVEGEGDAE